MIRVLVADDSDTARRLLVEILRADPALHVVGEAADGREAVSLTTALRPDVVVMDVLMPALDGFEATRQIMVEVATPIVIVSSHPGVSEVQASLRALEVGALTILPKPPGPGAPDFDERRARFTATVKAMAGVKVVRRWPERRRAMVRRTPRLLRARPRAVAVAASTGGPAALLRLLTDLPAAFPLPMLVVQHIADGFVEGLATWLGGSAGRAVRVARDGDRAQPGVVYVAPDDHHLVLQRGLALHLSSAPPVNGFRPSATTLFESAARALGPAVVAVVLTGMGEDGAAGAASVRRAGGTVIAQDAETSVVFGMPGAVVSAGLADAVLPIQTIAGELAAMAAEEA